MILTCPNCDTQYVVKDGAIPPEGRQVRCASCKHSWHQDPETTSGEGMMRDEAETSAAAPIATDVEPESEPQPVDHDEETVAEATLIEPRSGPEAEQRAYEEAVMEGTAPATEMESPAETDPAPAATSEMDETSEEPAAVQEDWNAPPDAEPTPDMFTPFADSDEVEQGSRGPLRAILTIAVTIIVLAALFWFFAPADLKAKLGLASAGASPLALVTTHMDRQRLESGNELLTVTGRVINPTAKEQDVPPLQAQLRSSAGKIVYSWTIAPPARSLPPGASASFNSAEVNVPPGGDELTITLGDPRA
jgi:predicted Zn finger-like uncharacterized protein